jgi:hypothetical protein
MQCRQCGAEIADKAIVCYRCGTGTTEPVRKAVPITPRRRPLVPAIVTLLLVGLAAFLWRYSSTTANPEYSELVAGVVLGAAIVVVMRAFVLRR